MTPMRVKAENYGPYKSFDWEVPEGLTAVVGVNQLNQGVNSNGSGKTKMLEAIPLALFGPSLPWSEYLSAGNPDATCVIELEFQHANHLYRVRRTYVGKGRGKTLLDFERFDDDAWVTLTQERQDETQSLIERTIGLTESMFSHSVFAGQGATHFADASLTSKERKEILADALGLYVWGKLLQRAQDDRRAIDRDLEKNSAAIDVLTGSLIDEESVEGEQEMLQSKIETILADIFNTEKEIEELNKVVLGAQQGRDASSAAEAHMRSAENLVTALEQSIFAFKKDVSEKEALLRDLQQAKLDSQGEEETRKTLERLEKDASAANEATTERDALLDEATVKDKSAQDAQRTAVEALNKAKVVENLAHDVENDENACCDRCNQNLHGESRSSALASYQEEHKKHTEEAQNALDESYRLASEAETLRGKALDLAPIIEKFDLVAYTTPLNALEKIEKAKQTVLSLTEQLEACEKRLEVLQGDNKQKQVDEAREELQRAREAYRASQDALRDVSDIEEELGSLKARVNTARKEENDIKERLAVLKSQTNQQNQFKDKINAYQEENETLTQKANLLKTLEEAYGRNGIPALILESQAIPQLETEAQRVVDELGLPYRIELLTQKENKTGGVRDTLDVVVHEPNGVRRYETYSGGEKTRLELALRIALARLIAQRSTTQVGMLALDEPSFLDASGHNQLANVLRSLTEFRTIVLVSHDEALVDAFDQKVMVVRDERGSQIEDAA